MSSQPASRAVKQRALETTAAVSVLLFVALYLFAVRTAWGQRLDATAVRGRHALRIETVHAAHRLLTTIDVASVALLGGAIVGVALLRGRPRLAVGAGIVMAGATLTSEILKHFVLPRPDLGVVDALGRTPSFPSGHTTVAMSLAVGAVLVAPSRWRSLVGMLGALYAGAIGVAVVATASHRASDPIGAVLVVTAWASTVLTVFIGRGLDERRETRGPSATPWFASAGLALLVIAFVGLAVTVVAIRRNDVDTVDLGGAFAAAAAAITGAVLVAMATLLAVLRGIALDPPRVPERDELERV